MLKFLKSLFFLVPLMFSSKAFSQSYDISFTFPSGGTGAISFDYPTACTDCLFTQMTNFTANFQIGANTWNQADMVAPAATTYLEFSPVLGKWFTDDTTAPVAGTTLLNFTNGAGAMLTFEIGPTGLARLDGVPFLGNFLAINTPVSVPTLSEQFLLLLITSLAILGLTFSRKNRVRRSSKWAF